VPDLNSGKESSLMDLQELEDAARSAKPIEEIAAF
jgi:hypothetical protein